jgi:uncharacterized membrane protein
MNFDNLKFHPSSSGLIMTDGRSKAELLGETCKKHLIECYIKEKYDREKDITNKYTEKGLAVEEDSITLYSRVTKKFYTKNDETLVNDLFVGTPDLFEGKDIHNATLIIDIKSSWDIYTFFASKTAKQIDKGYFYQLHAYMHLTGARKAKLVYCLVDTPSVLIEKEKFSLFYKMGVATMENPDFLEACRELEKNMTFNDVALKDRVCEFDVEYNPDVIANMAERIKDCREWMNKTFATPELIIA